MNELDQIRDKIKGPVFSVVTPFREEDDLVDYKALENYLSLIYQSGGRLFYVLAYNSRFSLLSWEEIKKLNEFVTKFVKSLGNDTVVIVADPLHCPTTVSMDFCKHAESIGADVISLVFREMFYSHEQVIKHYKMCADSCDIGLLIHEMPFINGRGGGLINWPIEILDRLADVPNIIALKEDAKDDQYSNSVISKIKDRISIVISGGGKRQWLRFAEAGCQSWLNGIGVFEPALAVKFWEAYQNKDQTTQDKIINKIEVEFFDKAVKKFGWHLAIKAALQARGLMSRHDRMPLLALGESDYLEVKELITSLPINDFKL